MRGSRRVATYPVPRMISPAITQDNTEMMIRVRITPLMTLNVRRPGYIRYRITSHPSAIVISVSVVTFDYPSPLTALASDTRRSRTEICPGKNT